VEKIGDDVPTREALIPEVFQIYPCFTTVLIHQDGRSITRPEPLPQSRSLGCPEEVLLSSVIMLVIYYPPPGLDTTWCTCGKRHKGRIKPGSSLTHFFQTFADHMGFLGTGRIERFDEDSSFGF
jgi:hypothetical protein